MGIGKIYKLNDDHFVASINYKLHDETPTNWWGELTFTDHLNVEDSEGYMIELDDSRRGRCHLKKRVNRAVTGIPPRYVYHVTGINPFE